MRALRLPLLATLAAALLTLGLTGPALAAPATGSPAESCVVTLAPPSGQPQERCFDNLAAAVSYATGGLVHISPNTNRVTQSQLDGGKRTAKSTGDTETESNLVIGIEYEDRDFRGVSKVYNVNATPCDKGGTYSDRDLRGDSLDDEISSARSYEGCVSTHYQYANFSGMKHACGCAGMGSMNDRTTSIRWS